MCSRVFGLGLGDRGISGPEERHSVLRVGRLRPELWLCVSCVTVVTSCGVSAQLTATPVCASTTQWGGL